MKRIIVGLISIFMTACGGSGGGNASGTTVNTSLDEASSMSENFGKSMLDYQLVSSWAYDDGALSTGDPVFDQLLADCQVVDSSSDTSVNIRVTDGTGTCPIDYSHVVKANQSGGGNYSGSMTLSYSILDGASSANRQLLSHSCTVTFQANGNGSNSMTMSASGSCTTVTRDNGSFLTQIDMTMNSTQGGSTVINSSGTISSGGKAFSFSIRFDSGSQGPPTVLINGQDATGGAFDGSWAQSLMVF